jgi:DNA-binding NarL/FixJ family response regulator
MPDRAVLPFASSPGWQSMSLPLHNMSVVLVDDHRVVAHGIRRLLKDRTGSFHVVESGKALLSILAVAIPDVVLLDINMPEMSGIETLEELRRLGIEVPVVMLTMHDDEVMVRRALSAGAIGYVVKHAAGDEVFTALEHAVKGVSYISPSIAPQKGASPSLPAPSPAQMVVLRLIGKGLRPAQIAAELGVSTRTVESHKYMLMQRFEVNTTLALLRVARLNGLI